MEQKLPKDTAGATEEEVKAAAQGNLMARMGGRLETPWNLSPPSSICHHPSALLLPLLLGEGDLACGSWSIPTAVTE